MKRMSVAVALLLFVAMSGYAAVIPTLELISPSGTSSGNTYLYSLDLAEGTSLDTSRPFQQALVIYDFAGYIPGTIGTNSGNWVTSVQVVGPVVPPEIQSDPNDDPAIVNLVFTYVGPLLLGPQNDFDFVFADSVFDAATLDRYQGQGTKVVPPPDPGGENGTATGTDGNVSVPVGGAVIPEPGTMGLLGSALLGIGMLRFRRKK